MEFPFQPMPKLLKRETLSEVDDSPAIYNARDYNIDERELVSIQRVLVGDGVGTNTGLLGLYVQTLTALRNITNNGLLIQNSGIIKSGKQVPFPASVPNVLTSGALTSAATTINVVSTTGFPTKGLLTKFNAVSATTVSNVKGYSFGKSLMNYEVISYNGVTPTSFTGCVRAVDGTAQDVIAGAAAMIVSGKASVILGNQDWTEGDQTKPLQFYIEHDATLLATSHLFDNKASLTPADTVMEITYALLVFGYFNDIAVGG